MFSFARPVVCAAAIGAALALSSCGTARFYAQAARGQWELLRRSRPIPEVKADPATPDALRDRLALVGELREFARNELHLPVKRQFSSYADLGRPFSVFAVYAAPEFSLEAKSWWYPLVGRAKYRGFFDEKLARQEVEALKAEGLDVYLGGVRVYSTLGWFADPVLNTFILEEPGALAETIFHELTHSRVFVGGDSDFNEAFATANAREGVRRWLRSKGDAAALRRYELGLRRVGEVLALLARARGELERLYANPDRLPPEEMRRAKARVFEGVRREYAAIRGRGGVGGARDGWLGKQFNNARLVSIATYHDLVPGFERVLAECGGDLEKFYARVDAMRNLAKAPRRELLNGPPTRDKPAGSARS